jgi:hypothetical protein
MPVVQYLNLVTSFDPFILQYIYIIVKITRKVVQVLGWEPSVVPAVPVVVHCLP